MIGSWEAVHQSLELRAKKMRTRRKQNTKKRQLTLGWYVGGFPAYHAINCHLPSVPELPGLKISVWGDGYFPTVLSGVHVVCICSVRRFLGKARRWSRWLGASRGTLPSFGFCSPPRKRRIVVVIAEPPERAASSSKQCNSSLRGVGFYSPDGNSQATNAVWGAPSSNIQ